MPKGGARCGAGRPPALTENQVLAAVELYKIVGQLGPVADAFSVSRTTMRKYLRGAGVDTDTRPPMRHCATCTCDLTSRK